MILRARIYDKELEFRDRDSVTIGRDPAADYHDIFICQADEPLIADVYRLSGTALPTERTGEHPVA